VTDYLITQTDRTLNSASIKLVKYENKVSRFTFDLDGTIPEGLRLYCAFLNPKTKKYFYSPVLYDIYNNDIPYVIVGTEITLYVGKWEMLLIGISPDSNIVDTNEIDDTLIVWSSTAFKKIVVLNTFIDDDAVVLTHPNLEKAMNDLVALHEDVVSLSSQVTDDATAVSNALARIEEIYTNIQSIQTDIQSHDDALTSRYNQMMSNMTATYSQYMEDLRREREGG